eukprot:scaffold11000_cov108-Isochrysis_galbana.AAC.6
MPPQRVPSASRAPQPTEEGTAARRAGCPRSARPTPRRRRDRLQAADAKMRRAGPGARPGRWHRTTLDTGGGCRRCSRTRAAASRRAHRLPPVPPGPPRRRAAPR